MAARPVSLWRSKVPPCGRMLGEVSDSKIVIEIGREDCRRRRARVQPEGPAPMMAIFRGVCSSAMVQVVVG